MASIAMGHPLAVTLAAVATLFGLIDNGFDISALLGLFANNAWGIFLNYTLVAIPLFIFMAQILDRSKVSEGLFDALYIVLGGLRGGPPVWRSSWSAPYSRQPPASSAHRSSPWV